jgi:hypothetical protein
MMMITFPPVCCTENKEYVLWDALMVYFIVNLLLISEIGIELGRRDDRWGAVELGRL